MRRGSTSAHADCSRPWTRPDDSLLRKPSPDWCGRLRGGAGRCPARTTSRCSWSRGQARRRTYAAEERRHDHAHPNAPAGRDRRRPLRPLPRGGHYYRKCPGPGFRVGPGGQDPSGQRRGQPAPRVPTRRTDRTVALAVHLPGRNPRIHRRVAGGGGERLDTECPPQPPKRVRGGDPNNAQRLRPPKPGRPGDRGDRDPPRHARARQGPGVRRESHQVRPGPGVRVGPGGEDPPGQRRRVETPRVPTR